MDERINEDVFFDVFIEIRGPFEDAFMARKTLWCIQQIPCVELAFQENICLIMELLKGGVLVSFQQTQTKGHFGAKVLQQKQLQPKWF